MSDRGYLRFLNLNLRSVQTMSFILFFVCMFLISLHYQKNCVWPCLKCHTSPPPPLPSIRWERVSHPRALHWLLGGDEWHFRLSMDIYVHPGINKGGIQRKHILLLWVGREGHNEETLSFFTDDWKNHSVKIIFFYMNQCSLFTILQT